MCVIPNNEALSDLATLRTCHMTLSHWSLVIVVHNRAHSRYSTPLVWRITPLLVKQLIIYSCILVLTSFKLSVLHDGK